MKHAAMNGCYVPKRMYGNVNDRNIDGNFKGGYFCARMHDILCRQPQNVAFRHIVKVTGKSGICCI